MSLWKVGDVARIVRGTTTTDDVGDSKDDYHFLVTGTLVRVDLVRSDAGRDGWGTEYVVSPVDDTPEVWVGSDPMGSQYVHDCHLAPPVIPTTIPDIEKFLEE